MLDTRFPRPVGDVGNPASWPVATLLERVDGAWPRTVVQSAAGLSASGMLQAFVRAVRELERQGACAITTSCGFLVLLQQELQAAVGIPVVSSSLLQLPELLRAESRAGVLTISATGLDSAYLAAAGVGPQQLGQVVVQGVDAQGEFAGAILGNCADFDQQAAQAEVVAAAVALKDRAPDLRTVVLECTNMPPYADAIRQATGLRVLSLVDSPVLRAALALDR